MPVDDEGLESLARVVRAQPEDVALRRLLAELLLDAGRPAEAEEELKATLKIAPDREDLKLALARALKAQGRAGAALSILETHALLGEASGAALMAQARLLLADDQVGRAAERYREAIARDPGLVDAFLAKRLGIDGDAATPKVVDGAQRVPSQGPSSPAGEGAEFDEIDGMVPVEHPGIDFGDVGGMESLKEEIRLKIIHPITHPDLYQAYGKSAGGGILLYGPPGCGKTHLARATAGEVHASFFSIGISDVLSMWLGESERQLHDLFEDARRRRPSVLFFDEVDALGASRADLRASAGRQLINQFLSELDGMNASNDGVLVLAATNAPWHLDPAFRRPGRFDRVLFVPPPDREARARILEILLAGKPVGEIDLAKLARHSDRFSGADLKALVDIAVEEKLASAMRSGTPKPLSTKELIAATKKVKPSTKEWFSTARNYVLYANEGGLYDDVRAHLGID